MQTHESVRRLTNAGISHTDAFALRRIAMTLNRWYKLECGAGSGAIERPFADEKPYFRYETSTGSRSYVIPDREAGAKKRLAAIMKRYPDLRAYIQTDPRGAALYILRPTDMIEGADIDSYYSRGIAVYK